MVQIKNGSKWSSGNGETFIVIGTMIVEGKDWVYYRSENQKEHLPQEFSCYKESFLDRFRQLPE